MRNTVIDINEVTLQKYVASLRSDDPEIRAELDFGYSYDGKCMFLFEIRPFCDNPKEILHLEYAKIRFYASRKLWKLYWKRASGKWELYEPFPESTHLEKIIEVL